MARRAALVVALAFVVGLPGAAGEASSGSGLYIVRPDPRACPSPLCGGYWVALANHARTACEDEGLRARCHVARAVDEARRPLAAGIADGALVRGSIEPWTRLGIRQLYQLVAFTVREPLGAELEGSYFRARDLGIRCVRAPCYHLKAARLNRPVSRLVSSVDLVSLVRPTPRQLARAQAALEGSGLLLLGTVIETSAAGTILQASRFYLRPG